VHQGEGAPITPGRHSNTDTATQILTEIVSEVRRRQIAEGYKTYAGDEPFSGTLGAQSCQAGCGATAGIHPPYNN
jgi:hypothetical protein